VHTLTHSVHGDVTIDERAITLAGEGIELQVVTDHDHRSFDQTHAPKLPSLDHSMTDTSAARPLPLQLVTHPRPATYSIRGFGG
jgi:hypothetical protein